MIQSVIYNPTLVQYNYVQLSNKSKNVATTQRKKLHTYYEHLVTLRMRYNKNKLKIFCAINASSEEYSLIDILQTYRILNFTVLS
jgi:hypothetical protein